MYIFYIFYIFFLILVLETNWKANAKIFWKIVYNIFSNISVKYKADWNIFDWERRF